MYLVADSLQTSRHYRKDGRTKPFVPKLFLDEI